MLSLIVRFLSAIFLVWLFRRVLAPFLGGSKTTRPQADPAASSNQMVKDPVCGMYMDSRLAICIERKREAYYFCSEDCKNKYLNQSGTAAGSSVAG